MSKCDTDNKREVLKKNALDVRERAYAPYSQFKVGAALLADNEKIYPGCNVENGSYGLTICAERNALTSAIADGARSICEIYIVADTDTPVLPCGACLQVLSEFVTPDVNVTCANIRGESKTYAFSELLPQQFSLKKGSAI